jgi:hypothetical protein
VSTTELDALGRSVKAVISNKADGGCWDHITGTTQTNSRKSFFVPKIKSMLAVVRGVHGL